MENKKFHLSIPCKDISSTRKFYEKKLGFNIGRSAYSWFDLNLFGNQITFTEDETSKISSRNYSFDNTIIPSFHFGVILDKNTWDKMFSKFKLEDFFAIGAKSFLVDKKGHHESFFIKDPNGYFIEFKTFIKESGVFETEQKTVKSNFG